MTDADLEHYCMLCGETWAGFYDAKSHVYTNHQNAICGTNPEFHVGTRDADADDEVIA